MAEKDYNENAQLENEKERLKRATIARMFAGARQEQTRFDELEKLRKELKHHLQVSALKTFAICQIISVSPQNGTQETRTETSRRAIDQDGQVRKVLGSRIHEVEA